MAAQESAGTILKILSGVQSGVDVALLDGEYTLGSGDDDDVQLFDVSLKPGHARLAIRPGKIEIGGGAGQLRTRNGLVLEAGGALQEVEPLDVVTAGTTRFALGPRTANWASITDVETDPAAFVPQPPKKAAAAAGGGLRWRSWRAVIAVIAVLVLVTGGVGLTSYNRQQETTREDIARSDVEIVRTALAKFDFHDRLNVHQELDGVLYVTGFVDEPVERRAVLGAIGDTAIPARVRITVLDLIRNEVVNLIDTEKVNVTFTLSETGELALKGVILDADRAAALVELVKERITGISSIKSEVRTAPTLLADAKALADRSQILPLVLLRLDGALIEASGVMPTEKIDAWVGFLQAYASQFADIIPLRSFVQLQNPDGTVTAPGEGPGMALVLGGGDIAGGDMPVDVNRLRSGNYDLADIFVGQKRLPQAAGGDVPAAAGDGPAVAAAAAGAAGERIDLKNVLGAGKGDPAAPGAGSGADPVADVIAAAKDAAGSGTGAPVAANAAGGEGVAGDPAVWTPDVDLGPAAGAGESLTDMGRRLITRWQDGTLDDTREGARLKKAMEALQNHKLGELGTTADVALTQRYAPLLASGRIERPGTRCWPDSWLTHGSVVSTLFWLDLLSVSTELSLIDLDAAPQALILEAALNPQWTQVCANAAAGRGFESTYLYEVSRNASFVRYIARDFSIFPIDVAGASVAGERYIQTRAGRKMHEGSAPDDSSRIMLVGQLGVAVQRESGYSTYIFDSSLNWLIR